jgi:hypothetical protein
METLPRQEIGGSEPLCLARDRDALDCLITAILLAEPSLIIAVADHQTSDVADRDLRLIHAAIAAAGPPDWCDADAVYARASRLLTRHPAALALAARLRTVGSGISSRIAMLDRAVAAVLGECGVAEREAISVRARLLCDPDDDDAPDLLRRLQTATR